MTICTRDRFDIQIEALTLNRGQAAAINLRIVGCCDLCQRGSRTRGMRGYAAA